MGGQACILYGAAEFSRDVDLAVLADERNLARLRSALCELRATRVFVPPLSAEVLRRGHACHFRCAPRGAERLRIDVIPPWLRALRAAVAATRTRWAISKPDRLREPNFQATRVRIDGALA
jgi:hypothetical protein